MAQKNLIEWLANNKEGWKGTPASYAPQVGVFGKNFSFNFMGETVIFAHGRQQYFHAIDLKQYQPLMCSDQK